LRRHCVKPRANGSDGRLNGNLREVASLAGSWTILSWK
jgi:hypothetical protein